MEWTRISVMPLFSHFIACQLAMRLVALCAMRLPHIWQGNVAAGRISTHPIPIHEEAGPQRPQFFETFTYASV